MAFDKKAAEASKRKAVGKEKAEKTSSGSVKKGRGGAKKTAINMLVTAVFALAYFYLELPAINLQSIDFYFFFFLVSAVYCVSAIVTSGIWKITDAQAFFPSVKKHCRVPLIICAVFVVVMVVGSLLSSVVLRSGSYKQLLKVETGSFEEEVAEISYDHIPMLDKDSSEKLGDRKLGELADMVSQFEVSSDYTQINYLDRPVRVTPLEYGDLIKWLNNRSNGLPGYIIIDMLTQNAEVVRLEEGMKYSTCEHFGRNLYRHLRFSYPTFMFGEPVFEINDDGEPYWVCPKIVKRIGLFGGRDVEGVVLVNAVTGESEYCKEAPQWVDRVYPAELIIEQYDYYGMYSNGFLNSLFGQRGVTVTTDGYNYIAQNDDVYVYTGVTSVGGDSSNIGFLLSNQRTKETRFYETAGAAEYSAMSSAEGVVQHLGYDSTFPILLNIGGEPTYFMSLKDAAGLVKMYAMVNVRSYQLVATGSSVAECEKSYRRLIGSEEELPTGDSVAEGVVSEIRTAVLDGNSVYYIRLEGGNVYYAAAARDAVILNVGDSVRISFIAGEGRILTADGLVIVGVAETDGSGSGNAEAQGADGGAGLSGTPLESGEDGETESVAALDENPEDGGAENAAASPENPEGGTEGAATSGENTEG